VKKLLTYVIKRRIYMSHAASQRREKSPAAQSRAHRSARTQVSARCCPAALSSLLDLPTSGVSLPRNGEDTETPASPWRCQSLLHRQAVAKSGPQNPHLCRFNGIDLERDCQPGVAHTVESRGRSWTITSRALDGGCSWNINSIVCRPKSWFRLMTRLSPTASVQLAGKPRATRRA